MVEEGPRGKHSISGKMMAVLALGLALIFGIAIATLSGRHPLGNGPAADERAPPGEMQATLQSEAGRTATPTVAEGSAPEHPAPAPTSKEILALGGKSSDAAESEPPSGFGTKKVKPGQAKDLRGAKSPRDVVPTDRISANFEPPLPKNQLTPGQVRRILGENERDMATCYVGRRSKHNKVDLTLVVEPSGEVSNAAVEATPKETPEISDCLALKARAWKFPAFGGDAAQRVTVPLVVVRGRG